MATTGTAALVTAVEKTWAAIQENHPDAPDVIVTVAAGSGGKGGGLTLGHFAPSRWVRDDKDVHELFVGGEGLARGAAAVLGTLLHEAAHGIAATRQIQDTSRQGRYHNKKFKALAAEVGIEVEHSAQLGYSTTTVPAATAARYAADVEALAAAINAYRRPEATIEGKPKSNNGVAMECACPSPRKIRASLAVAAGGPILCGLCDSEFTARE